ncbi:hypothetical protein Egran_05348 [Elaphomyces granulatus]|uniref:Sex determining protein n=1 Tax=Elaphomyces granulatus TaxID=519963 RepID=A0A232LSU6_9EURO|nr:hypothetical protein Egran_05348 [Elaphomyces granulatus]
MTAADPVMSVFGWNTDSPTPGGAPSNPPGGSPSFQVSQLRWLPSVLSRQNNLPPGPGAVAPPVTSTLRPPASISNVVDSPPADTPGTTGGHNSDSRPSTRDATAVEPDEETEYPPSPHASHRPPPGADLETPTSVTVAGLLQRLEDPDNQRNHGKRLTTKEEVSLFEICNRHADTFGERNKLCEWWKNVTTEFIQEQGHPYSWHSVRRKVEVVTKQRIKFLADQKEKGGRDLSNQQWSAAVDAWIPTWERFEEAETKRIETRDARRGRKRKDRSWEYAKPWENTAETWRTSSSPTSRAAPPPPTTATTTTSTTTAAAAATATATAAVAAAAAIKQSSSSSSSTVRLPAGFDSIFPSQTPHTPTPWAGGMRNAAPSQARGGYASTSSRHQHLSSSSPAAAAAAAALPESSVTTAVLEMLSKLNQRLDDVAASPQGRTSPLVAALAAGGDNQSALSGTQSTAENGHATTHVPGIAPAMNKIKDELRTELRDEFRREIQRLEERIESLQRNMILELLRQGPS